MYVCLLIGCALRACWAHNKWTRFFVHKKLLSEKIGHLNALYLMGTTYKCARKHKPDSQIYIANECVQRISMWLACLRINHITHTLSSITHLLFIVNCKCDAHTHTATTFKRFKIQMPDLLFTSPVRSWVGRMASESIKSRQLVTSNEKFVKNQIEADINICRLAHFCCDKRRWRRNTINFCFRCFLIPLHSPFLSPPCSIPAKKRGNERGHKILNVGEQYATL